jgi:TolB-like protein
LAAILVSDIVGYSAMMERDEAETLSALKSHRDGQFNPALAEHGGRLVKLLGDGALIEFASVVDAVNFAVDLQRRMAAEPAGIVLRIGINLGDIVIDGNDIYGDGVNVAARLEPLAEPGGICVSAIVHDSLGSRIAASFRDGGEVRVKNFERPVHIWKWHPNEEASGGGSQPAQRSEPRTLPSIAVLPFQNMSADAEQEYFADGIVEDIITALSRFRSFTVAARNSTFVYKGQAVDIRRVARELGVRYVLEGSVRRAGTRLRVAAQLIDGATGSHLWAEKFDGAVANVFDVQDRITANVAATVEPAIQRAEVERSRIERPASLDAYDLYLRATARLISMKPVDNAEGLALLDRVVQSDPGFTRAVAMAAWGREYRIHMGLKPYAEDDIEKCLSLARRALADARDDALVIAHCGVIFQLCAGEWEEGIRTVERAVALNPNMQAVQFFGGVAEFKGGSLDRALAYFERARDLNPSEGGNSLAGIGHVHLSLGDYSRALELGTAALTASPTFGWVHWLLIAAHAHLGRQAEAEAALRRYRAIFPEATLARIRIGQKMKDPARAEILFSGLARAGLAD